jgi:hypothetical protein
MAVTFRPSSGADARKVTRKLLQKDGKNDNVGFAVAEEIGKIATCGNSEARKGS